MIKENKTKLDAVLMSVNDLHKAEVALESDSKQLVQFVDFLMKNADDVGCFKAVENEIINDLQKFSFDKIDYSPIDKKISSLPVVKHKLANLAEEAKKLKGKPDRYNCYNILEACKKVASFCVNEMKATDQNKAVEAIDKIIPTLISIQKEFEIEDKILAEINERMNQHSAVLNKYKAFKTEMDQFVANFPNNRDTDLKIVEQHFFVLNKVDMQINELLVDVKKLDGFLDKFGNSKALEDCKKLVLITFNEMKYSECDRVIVALNTSIQKLRTIKNQFDILKNLLNKHSATLNKYAAFKTEIDHLLDKENSVDLKTLEQQLLTLSEIDRLYQQIVSMISHVQSFADKYQKNTTVQEISRDLNFARTQMRLGDTNKVRHDFGLAVNRMQKLTEEFENENKNVEKILKALQQRKPSIWKEDNEKLISDLTATKNKDPRKDNNFVIQDFLNRIQKAQDKKKQDIAAFEQYHNSWMKKNRNKKKLDTEIKNKYVSLEDFKTFVDSQKGGFKRFLYRLFFKK